MMLLCFHHRTYLCHEPSDYGYLRHIIAVWWQMNEISLVLPVQMLLCISKSKIIAALLNLLYAARGACVCPRVKPQLAKPCGVLFHKEERNIVACLALAIQSGLILAKSPDLQYSNVTPIFNTCLLNPTETH